MEKELKGKKHHLAKHRPKVDYCANLTEGFDLPPTFVPAQTQTTCPENKNKILT